MTYDRELELDILDRIKLRLAASLLETNELKNRRKDMLAYLLEMSLVEIRDQEFSAMKPPGME